MSKNAKSGNNGKIVNTSNNAKSVKSVKNTNQPKKVVPGLKDYVWEKYKWEIWLESKGVPLGWWKGTRVEPWVVNTKLVLMFVFALGIPTRFFMGIDWYYSNPSRGDVSQVYQSAKKG